MEDPTKIPYIVQQIAKEGDLILFVGAGSITCWANSLSKQLEALSYPLQKRLPIHLKNSFG
jgi:UDP-N-acetylmuramate-alanine ligase